MLQQSDYLRNYITGRLELRISSDDGQQLHEDKNYSMIESLGMFEANRHNLRLIQQMNAETLRLQKYIVNGISEISPLGFVNPNTEYSVRHANSGEKTMIKIFDLENWPSAQTMNLDEIQKQAVHAALTKELCIIQGPSGTGKTFIASTHSTNFN